MPISAALGSSALLPAGLGFRNKLINGDMRINQRGSGVITGSGSRQFPVDQWGMWNGTGTVTFQQSTTAPTGFTNSLLATVTSTGSYGTSGYTQMQTKIEGFNCQDLAWGTASAKTITLSFWCRASVTGTYPVGLRNSAADRSYVATFTVNTANTWEYKTLYIPGDTTGTWLTNNGVGLDIVFNLGLGTGDDTSTPNTWISGNKGSTSSCVDFASNAGATFYLTGVQLEQNTQATPFEQRPYGVELALCQRYFHIVPATDMYAYNLYWNVGLSGGSQVVNYKWPVPMRAVPTIRTSAGSATALDFSYFQNAAGAGLQRFLEDTGASSVYGCKTLLYSSNNNSNNLLTANGYTMAQCQIPLWVNAEL